MEYTIPQPLRPGIAALAGHAPAGTDKAQGLAGGCVGQALASGDVLEFVVTGTPATCTRAWLFLRVRRT